MQKTISIVVPVYNEEKNIPLLYAELLHIFTSLSYKLEIILVNDGSKDASQEVAEKIAQEDSCVKVLEFSRNFGKESATSAGIHHAQGDAVIAIDADMQHPPALIPTFLQHWERGADVVIGTRTKNNGQTFLKGMCSSLYYKVINAISDTPIEPNSTDFRLLDRKVVDAFNTLTEHDRMTRGLIDWLGFRRVSVPFEAGERANGTATYSYLNLAKLALSSTVAHSLFPLKVAGYLGLFITFISLGGGTVVFIQRYIFDDVLGWGISGTAQLAILMIFFIGIILSCLGLVAMYIGNITHEVSGRPLYVVRSKKNVKEEEK